MDIRLKGRIINKLDVYETIYLTTRELLEQLTIKEVGKILELINLPIKKLINLPIKKGEGIK